MPPVSIKIIPTRREIGLMDRFLFAVVFLLVLCPHCAPAFEIEPFNSFNQSPVVRIFGLPGAGSPRVIEACRTELDLSANLTTNYILDENNRESLLIAG
jgi:hypothetical protein